jgi:hypothetical protein
MVYQQLQVLETDIHVTKRLKWRLKLRPRYTFESQTRMDISRKNRDKSMITG